MNKGRDIHALWIRLIAPALLAPGVVLAAAAVQTAPSGSSPAVTPEQEAVERGPELEEVLVEGRKPLRDAQKILDWMARLVGRFVVDGSVNLRGQSESIDPLQVQGRADCTGFGPGPAVHCELKIRWPDAKGPNGEALFGGVSNLNPANLLFGFEPDHIGIRYMMVDSSGIAEGALGYLLTGDTLVSRTKCVNVPGNCERVVWITAEPDLKQVEMKIDLEMELKRVVRFTFMLHRVPGSPAVVMPGTNRP